MRDPAIHRNARLRLIALHHIHHRLLVLLVTHTLKRCACLHTARKARQHRHGTNYHSAKHDQRGNYVYNP